MLSVECTSWTISPWLAVSTRGPREAPPDPQCDLGGLTAAGTGPAGDAAGGAVRIRAQSRVLAVSVVHVAVAGAGGAVLGADAVAGQAAIVPTVAVDREAGQAEPSPTGAEAGGAPVRVAEAGRPTGRRGQPGRSSRRVASGP